MENFIRDERKKERRSEGGREERVRLYAQTCRERTGTMCVMSIVRGSRPRKMKLKQM